MATTIRVETTNCDQDRHFLVTESADSSVLLEMRFDEIVSMQSRTERKRELVSAIQAELSKFRWLVAGSVRIEFAWYLHAVERQETDKVGDIDNITKPILDSLSGPSGLLIDDSQIGSVHTFWMSRNHQLTYSVLRLELQFNNDECLEKDGLFFIQYNNATCLAININLADHKSVFGALLVVKARRWHRAMAKTMRALGDDRDRFLVGSTWDFHRTRLNGFSRTSVVTLRQLIAAAATHGFSRSVARGLWKPLRATLLKMKLAKAGK